MKRERLIYAIGKIDDDLIYGAVNDIKAKKKGSWFKWKTIAACLCVAIIVGILFQILKPDDFNSMIAKKRATDSVNLSLSLTNVEIGNRTAWYQEIAIDSIKLEKYIGEQYQQQEDRIWFYPAGIDNLKYLINQADDGSLSLWEFNDFEISYETYTYGDVLKIIYGVESVKDIVSITTTPFRGDNTDLGEKIQKEVGTHTYKNREDITTFYNIVVGVKRTHRKPFDKNRFTYSFSTEEQDKDESGEITYGTRVLSIKLTDGTTVDGWMYNALDGVFSNMEVFFQNLYQKRKCMR